MNSLIEQFLSVWRFLWPIKIHLNNNINYHIFSKLIERKNNMLTKHAIIWSIFPNMLFCHMERIDRFSLLYQDRPQNISFFSRYIVTRQLHSKIVQERKGKEWFINSLLCCTEKDLWAYSSLFFLGYHGIKVTTTHFPLSLCQRAAGWQSVIQTCFLLGEW